MTSLPPDPYGVEPLFPPAPGSPPPGPPPQPETGALAPPAEPSVSLDKPAPQVSPMAPSLVPPAMYPPMPTYPPSPYGQLAAAAPAPTGAYGYPAFQQQPQAAWYPGISAPWRGVARPRTSGAAAGLGWAIAVLGVLVAVAAFVTWGHVHLADGTSCRVRGFDDGNCGRYTDNAYNLGVATTMLSIPIIVMGVLRGCVRRRGLSLATAIVGLVLGALVALIGIDGTTAPDGLPASARFASSTGVWLTLALGIVLVVVSVAGIVKRR